MIQKLCSFNQITKRRGDRFEVSAHGFKKLIQCKGNHWKGAMKIDTIFVLFEYFFEINRLGVARMVYDANKVAPFQQGKIFINRYVSNVYSMPAS